MRELPEAWSEVFKFVVKNAWWLNAVRLPDIDAFDKAFETEFQARGGVEGSWRDPAAAVRLFVAAFVKNPKAVDQWLENTATLRTAGTPCSRVDLAHAASGLEAASAGRPTRSSGVTRTGGVEKLLEIMRRPASLQPPSDGKHTAKKRKLDMSTASRWEEVLQVDPPALEPPPSAADFGAAVAEIDLWLAKFPSDFVMGKGPLGLGAAWGESSGRRAGGRRGPPCGGTPSFGTRLPPQPTPVQPVWSWLGRVSKH